MHREGRYLLPLLFLLAPSWCRVIFRLTGGSRDKTFFCAFDMSLMVEKRKDCVTLSSVICVRMTHFECWTMHSGIASINETGRRTTGKGLAQRKSHLILWWILSCVFREN